jgi:hypothetical protein
VSGRFESWWVWTVRSESWIQTETFVVLMGDLCGLNAKCLGALIPCRTPMGSVLVGYLLDVIPFHVNKQVGFLTFRRLFAGNIYVSDFGTEMHECSMQ